MKTIWQSVITIGFIFLLIFVQIVYWMDPVTLSNIISIKDKLFFTIQHYPVLTSISYIFIYILSIIFGLPISITIVGGYLFGFIRGSIYSIVGIVCGTTILNILVRYVIGDWIQDRYSDDLKPLNKQLSKYGMYYIFIINIIPFMPSFLPNVATGISTIPLGRVVVIHTLGAFPLTLLYTLAGTFIPYIDSVHRLIYYITIFSIIIGLLFFIGIFYFQKKLR